MVRLMTWLFSGLITDSLARQSWGRQGEAHSMAGCNLLATLQHPQPNPYLVTCFVHGGPLGGVIEIQQDVLAALGLQTQRLGTGGHRELGRGGKGELKE